LRGRSGGPDVDAAKTEVVHALAQDQECSRKHLTPKVRVLIDFLVRAFGAPSSA
jgi:hypothetical protein